MKVTCYLLLLLVAGCNRRSDSTSPTTGAETEIPMALLQKLPERVKLVRVGMTEEKALKTLGLSAYRLRGFGDGPRHIWTVNYLLRTNCTLMMGLDMTKVPPTVTLVRGGFSPAIVIGDGGKGTETR